MVGIASIVALHAAVDFPAAPVQKRMVGIRPAEVFVLAAGILAAVFIAWSKGLFESAAAVAERK